MDPLPYGGTFAPPFVGTGAAAAAAAVAFGQPFGLPPDPWRLRATSTFGASPAFQFNGLAPDAARVSEAARPEAASAWTRGAAEGGSVPRDAEEEGFSVVIRVRPPLERELASPGWQNVINVGSSSEVTLHEVFPETPGNGDRATSSGDRASQVVTNHLFTFDRVYCPESLQPEVYNNTARASVLSTLKGYNAAIIAYGPTGTGKTYTMEGPHDGENRGIIPRCTEEMFQHIQHWRGPQCKFLVRASYLQIYNESISDLLKPDRHHLVIREDRRRGVFVEGLSEWLCKSPSEVHMLMERGSAVRATAHTAANDASSRSHAVFIVVVEQSEALPEEESQDVRASSGSQQPRQSVRVGRLNLVDLAGSERPRLTGAVGQRLEETKKINQSLSALGNVIAVLTERKPRQHIPYRDSKLTRLLEDSLGGNCRTTMMAMVSPAAEAFAESLSTLKFAHRAKAIRNSPQVNEDVDHRTLLRRYETELRQLRAELRHRSHELPQQLQEQVQELEEERRRAAEDRAAAVSALEERSMVLEAEKASKRELESRIQQMTSQMLVGGQQERIYSECAAKLSELERERQSIEEDKAQVGRYKQLLLKQRDIMIALTQRLHERDDTILALQADLDVRDRHMAKLEEQLSEVRPVPPLPLGSLAEGRSPRGLSSSDAFLQRQSRACGSPQGRSAGTGGAGSSGELTAAEVEGFAADGTRAQYPPEKAIFDLQCDRPLRLLSAEEKVTELSALLDRQRQENYHLALELDARRSAPTQALGTQAAQQRSLLCGLADRLAEAVSEVTGPAIMKLKLSQDVTALRRLVGYGGAPATSLPPSGTEHLREAAWGGQGTGPAAGAAPSGGGPGEARAASSPYRGERGSYEGSMTPMSDASLCAARSTPRSQPGLRGRRSLSIEHGVRPGSAPSPSRAAGGNCGSARQPSPSRPVNHDKPLTVRRTNSGGAGGSGIGARTSGGNHGRYGGERVTVGGASGSSSSLSGGIGSAYGVVVSSGCASTGGRRAASLGSTTGAATAAAMATATSATTVAGAVSPFVAQVPSGGAVVAFGFGGEAGVASSWSSNMDVLAAAAAAGSSPNASFDSFLGASSGLGLWRAGFSGRSSAASPASAGTGATPSASISSALFGSGGLSASFSAGGSRGPVRATPFLAPAATGFGGDEAGNSSQLHPGGATPTSLPPATAAALMAAAAARDYGGNVAQSRQGGNLDVGSKAGGSDLIEAFREEAQRSVDALLARRKAELSRVSGIGLAGGRG